MRGKRSKQYRKLMHQYALSFNFREPYQVLVDAQMIQDTARFSMSLPHGLERTLHGQVKPMITQCSIRHLYTAEGADKRTKDAWIETAKSFERRRCNHHTLPEPLSSLECITSVVDPKSSGTNKHRYVVASQDQKVRASMRQIAGVPLIYVNRSVMIMEPMATKTEQVREMDEKGKVRAGLKPRRGDATEDSSLKRKRSDDDDNEGSTQEGAAAADAAAKKRKKGGPKGPNPLSVKKSKKKPEPADMDREKQTVAKVAKIDPQATEKALDSSLAAGAAATSADEPQQEAKRKRRRKHKTAGEAGDAPEPADASDA